MVSNVDVSAGFSFSIRIYGSHCHGKASFISSKTERILGAFIFYDKMITFLNFNVAQELKWFY